MKILSEEYLSSYYRCSNMNFDVIFQILQVPSKTNDGAICGYQKYCVCCDKISNLCLKLTFYGWLTKSCFFLQAQYKTFSISYRYFLRFDYTRVGDIANFCLKLVDNVEWLKKIKLYSDVSATFHPYEEIKLRKINFSEKYKKSYILFLREILPIFV